MENSVICSNLYSEIKGKQPDMFECFFAFSDAQFAEGVKKSGLEGKKVFRGKYGLYGSDEGIKKFMSHYDDLTKEIADKCSPQEVYEYEFWNHECEYVSCDQEALDVVIAYFGEERVSEVKRRFA